MSLPPTSLSPRNLGPKYGFQVIYQLDKWMPRWISRPILFLGSGVAVFLMSVQRQFSREYLSEIRKKKATLFHVWWHFFNLTSYLVGRLQASHGKHLDLKVANGREHEFHQFISKTEQFLIGTFHVGYSDLLGFYLNRFERKISMIRLKMENSSEMKSLHAAHKDFIDIIWANDQQELTFALMQALADGRSLALQCDRVQHASKLEVFNFLNKQRQFPFSIYHLSAIYGIPVCFCFAFYDRRSRQVKVYPSQVYYPEHKRRQNNVKMAKKHFQMVLDELELLLQKYPYQWYNFLPLS